MDKLCTDTGYVSLNKKGEQLCGDRVEIIARSDNSSDAGSGGWPGQRREGQYPLHADEQNPLYDDGQTACPLRNVWTPL